MEQIYENDVYEDIAAPPAAKTSANNKQQTKSRTLVVVIILSVICLLVSVAALACTFALFSRSQKALEADKAELMRFQVDNSELRVALNETRKDLNASLEVQQELTESLQALMYEATSELRVALNETRQHLNASLDVQQELTESLQALMYEATSELRVALNETRQDLNASLEVQQELTESLQASMYEATSEMRVALNETQQDLHTAVEVQQMLSESVQNLSNEVTFYHKVKDCQEFYERGERADGIYEIQTPNISLRSFSVFCEFSDGHGWTVIQKRFDGSVDFYRDWNEYKNGFGSLDGEYWLGNDKIHALTQTNQNLNIYVKADNGNSGYGNWQTFHISDESDKYRLTVSEEGYSGDLPQGRLTYHNGMQFSTKDQDNDVTSTDCAVFYKAGWWYKGCQHLNLNGLYNNGNRWANFANNLIATTMKVTRD